MDLNKEIWLPELLEGFVPDGSFLSEARDMSAFTEHDKIHLAEAGAFPEVLVNNTSYPIPTMSRTDTPLSIELDTLSTKSTVVRRIEAIELSYDKLQSVIYGHKEALRQQAIQRAAHAFAPASNGTATPVMSASGKNGGAGVKALTFEDILSLENKFDNAEVPHDGRVLVLSATHKSQLRKQDLTAYKDIFDRKLFGSFKVYTLADDRMPKYDKTNGARLALGSTATTATLCSIAFHKDEVMQAMGSAEMFSTMKDPNEQGDKINFLMRFVAAPIRNKGIGAIYSANA